MKTLFIPSKRKLEIKDYKISNISKKLPKNIVIAYSIQYKDFANKIKDILSKKHKINGFIQVLGCSNPSFSKNTQAILLIGSGEFHSISLAYETKLPIYILEGHSFRKVSKDDIKKLEKKEKAAYVKFLNAKKIGIIVSLKSGQENFKRAIDLKRKIKNKENYLFITNDINIREFENFNEIDSWVNTACPRLDFDTSFIINIGKIKL